MITLLVADMGTGYIPPGYTSYEDICRDIQAMMHRVWEHDYAHILRELRTYTTSAALQVDYQQLLIECLKFPYSRPLVKNCDGQDIASPVYQNIPSIVNTRSFQEGWFTDVTHDAHQACLTAVVPIDEFGIIGPPRPPTREVVQLTFPGGIECGGKQDILHQELEDVYEIPLIDFYKARYNIRSHHEKRCLLIDVPDETTIGYVLFDAVEITVRRELMAL